MSSNEQCRFELALVKVRQIQNRWSGCVPLAAARRHGLAPGGQGAGTSPLCQGTCQTVGTGTGQVAGGAAVSPTSPRSGGEGGPSRAAEGRLCGCQSPVGAH